MPDDVVSEEVETESEWDQLVQEAESKPEVESPWDTSPKTPGQDIAFQDFITTIVKRWEELDTTIASSVLTAAQSIIRASGLPTKKGQWL